MTAPQRASPTIGPATEALIQAAFASSCTITANAAAQVLGFDVKTLRNMTDEGLIRAVPRGTAGVRAYTEGDIRAFLTESAAPCPSIAPRKARTGSTTSNKKVVDFTDRRASKRAAQPKR